MSCQIMYEELTGAITRGRVWQYFCLQNAYLTMAAYH